MEFIIRRTLKINRYIYKIDVPVEGCEYSGEANYCYNIWLRKINAINSINKRICSLKQTNWLLKIVTWIPLFWILPIGLVPKYKYFENETCKGGTNRHLGDSTGDGTRPLKKSAFLQAVLTTPCNFTVLKLETEVF